MKLRKRSRALALRAVTVLTAFVLLAIFLRVIRVEFSSSSVQISSAGFQVVVSWGSSKPMVADKSQNVEFFVKGAPDSDDSTGVFSFVDSLDPNGDVLTDTIIGSMGVFSCVDVLEPNVNVVTGNMIMTYDASVSSLQTVGSHRDSCTTTVRNNGWDNSILSPIAGGGMWVLVVWSSSVASDTVELLECELGQLLSLLTDRSAKEQITSPIGVQQNHDKPPISLIGKVLFPPVVVPLGFLWIQPTVFSSPLIVFAILKIPILGLLHDTSTSSDLDGVVPRPGALSA